MLREYTLMNNIDGSKAIEDRGGREVSISGRRVGKRDGETHLLNSSSSQLLCIDVAPVLALVSWWGPARTPLRVPREGGRPRESRFLPPLPLCCAVGKRTLLCRPPLQSSDHVTGSLVHVQYRLLTRQDGELGKEWS